MVCPLDQHAVGTGACQWCGKRLRGRQTRWCSRSCQNDAVANHRWTQAKARAKAAVRTITYRCKRCGFDAEKVEVNHVEPCIGKHGVWGCHHHQENLEVLCIPCHREVTQEQRAAGKFPRKKTK